MINPTPYFYTDVRQLPLSFTYNGVSHCGFPAETFPVLSRQITTAPDRETTETLLGFEDVLTIRVKQTLYPAFGTSECTLYFENTGNKNSGVLSDIHAQLHFAGANPVLKGILGDHVNQYRPYEYALEKEPVHFVSDSGRATHINFPYFNLECGDGGALLAIGWAGTWQADFQMENGQVTYTARSVNNLSTYLKPGESIRSALYVCLPYGVRDEAYATNYWRRWFIACNMPKADKEGHALLPFSTCSLASDTGLPNSDGSISERYTTWRPSLEKMFAEDCKVDYRWFDAGWYSAPNGDYVESDWFGTVGSWELCKTKWPGKTFLESTDFTRANGMRTLMWFEPERVTDPDSLVANYGYKREWAIEVEGSRNITNNIGNPDCFRWTVDRVCKVLRENHVDMYREDNNIDAGALWKHMDAQEGANRQGITECKLIDGHYKMWDEIIACTLSYGGCGFVDSCASGGGRNDLESMRRGIPMLRSDSDRQSTSLRLSMTTSFNKWIPFCGANTKEKVYELDATGDSDVYIWRASYLAALNVDSQFVQDPEQDFSILRNGLKEWKKVAPYLLKDFYTLTPWHDKTQKDGFTAFSFYDPAEENGFMLLFRMEDCEQDALTIRLPYAKADRNYLLTNEDTQAQLTLPGEALRTGYTFRLPEKRTAQLLWIRPLS